MYETRYHRPSTPRRGRGALCGRFRRPLPRRRTDADPDHEAAACRAVGRHRLVRHAELQGICGERRRRRHRRRTRPRRRCARPTRCGRRSPRSPTSPATIGDPAVRHRGTIGGSLANNDPAADYPAVVMALNATIRTDKRTIAARGFLHGAVRRLRSKRGSYRLGLVSGPGEGGVRQVQEPRLALCDGRRLRGEAQGRRGPRRRHRRPWRRRIPLGRTRTGADRVWTPDAWRR